MATRTQTIRISDLSGEDLGEGGQTIHFSIGSTSYTLDASEKEAEKFYDTLKKYTDAAQKVSGRGVRKSGSTKTNKEELQAMRTWLRENGHEVSDRGRISQELQDLYHQAH